MMPGEQPRHRYLNFTDAEQPVQAFLFLLLLEQHRTSGRGCSEPLWGRLLSTAGAVAIYKWVRTLGTGEIND